MFKLPVSPKKVAWLLLAVIIGLSLANLWGQYYKDFGGNDEFILKIVNKLDLDLEVNNFPTWYQSSTLLLCSIMLMGIAFIRKNLNDIDSRFWGAMAAIFLYLSIDEAISIHEQLSVPLRQSIHAHGPLFFSWVIPASIFLVLLFMVSAKSMWRLSTTTRWLFIVSGIIYVSGAVGMEMVGASYYEIHLEGHQTAKDFGYVLLTTLEEFLEMAGIVLFIFSLLRYLELEAFLPAKEVEQKISILLTSEISFSKQNEWMGNTFGRNCKGNIERKFDPVSNSSPYQTFEQR
ncbi:hypothetical protein BH10ACI1_BH10ACI1_10350 [soil metagenome]